MANGLMISFVIPSFSDSRILEAIDSILNLELKREKYQIVIQDGGSNENILTSIKAKLSNQDILSVEIDGGIFDAINKGVDKAKGHFIITLGSDDRCVNLNEKTLNRFIENGVDIITADIQYTSDDWTPIRFWRGRKVSIWNYLIGRQYAHFGLICTKAVYDQVGKFNIYNKTNADYEFFYYLCLNVKKFKQSVHNQVVTQMRIGGNSSKNIQTILRANMNILKFIFKTNPLLFIGFTFKPFHKLNEYLNRNNI